MPAGSCGRIGVWGSDVQAADLETAEQCDEARRVVMRRYQEARDAGLTLVESRLFAESGVDVGLLRSLVRHHCRPQLIARILV